jgi:hypothetical protein
MQLRFAGLLAVLLLVLQGDPASMKSTTVPPPAPPPPCRISTTLPNPAMPEIDCPAPPSTFATAALFAQNPAMLGPTFDSWAWATFAALNWPVKQDSTQPSGYVRGIPDTSKTFVNAMPADVLVWETFQEKREIFNSTVTAGMWQNINYPSGQEMVPAGTVPMCTAADAQLMSNPRRRVRRVLQSSKLSPALTSPPPPSTPALGPHSLDETAEVASPAQESQNALCAGYSGPALIECRNLFPPPPGGDATTPYSPILYTNPRQPVGPRVLDPNGNTVFYEVRLNYDYFNYVVGNGLNENPLPATPALPYKLPWRTSAPAAPGTGTMQPTPLLTGYDPNKVAAMYGAAPAPTTPPPVGSIQIKSAWMKVPRSMKNTSTFHTTEALYFDNRSDGTLCYKVDKFALIGLHIIQRVHMGDSSSTAADPIGGTFVFATWEHNSIASGSGYSYVNFLTTATSSDTPYPKVANAIPVTRQQPYPLATTAQATAGVYSQLPTGSVWSNYRLIGTQFYPAVNSWTSQAVYNQPYYLANLVIETNNGLQNFQGLPPNVTPLSTYTQNGVQPSGAAFSPALFNLSFNGNAYNMGGCMGCHGVAQINGASFSFVLFDGQNGAGIDTHHDLDIPPQGPPPTTSTGGGGG